MDFSRINRRIPTSPKPLHPIEIFEKLPNLATTPNDIWRGQNEALTRWHESRTKNDILISLNTGAGKTLVGLLVAQSLVNEGVTNVLYLCATIDLVNQTSSQASAVGIEHTTRIEGDYSNDLFESGRTFCITTYQALFNGLSSIRRSYFPGAVVFDDAHVAESMLRDAFTLRIDTATHDNLVSDIRSLFRPHFEELGYRGRFDDTKSPEFPTICLASPGGVRARSEQLINIFDRYRIRDDQNLKYSFAHLRDKLDRCAILFGGGSCEIAPPFLPSLSLDIFDRPIRRVYLSATLASKTDFIRAFGRTPDIAIEPRNDAGNGERLIIFGRSLRENTISNAARSLASSRKVLIAVRSYQAATPWAALCRPPEQRTFSQALNIFRKAATGAFLLVSRVDGIDLPHDTCRIMVLDGLPSGASLLDKYQWEFLNMHNSHAARLANRVVQLFGRINRGRNDYGAFLINGRDINTWLNNDRNVALLPDLLQQQISLGRLVQDEMSIPDSATVCQLVNTVIDRNPSWLSFYSDNITKSAINDEQASRTADVDARITKAALAESSFARYFWDGDYRSARNTIDTTIEDTARGDTQLAGWHNIWLGACYEAEGDTESALLSYRRAKQRLGVNVTLPTGQSISPQPNVEPMNSFATNIDSLVGSTSSDLFGKEVSRLEKSLLDLDGASPRQMEESVRALGDVFGFQSTRPDNSIGTGPDVLWKCLETKHCLAFELKTDKQPSSTYGKGDIGQAHDHISWIHNEHTDSTFLGLLFVGPDIRRAQESNPSNEMWLCLPQTLADLRDELLAIIRDTRSLLPLERRNKAVALSKDVRWTLPELAKRLKMRAI